MRVAKRHVIIFWLSVCLVISWHRASAQLPAYASVSALRASGETKNQIILQGYTAAGDPGGGILFNNGRGCVAVSQTVSWTTGNAVIITSNTSGMYVGDAVAPSQSLSGIPDYDQIVAINPGVSFTLAIAPALTGGPATMKTTCDNNGTVFAAAGQTTPQAYVRTSSNFSQNEWGAFNLNGDTSDRSVNLQFWLNAPQPHIALAGTVYTALPLVCPPGGAIQGPPTTAVAENSTVLPAFVIKAVDAGITPQTIFGVAYSAMLTMPIGQACGIHGVGFLANSLSSSVMYNTIDAMGISDVIDGHSYLSGGYNNVNSGSGGNGASANIEIYDSSLNNSVSTNALINSPNAKLMRSNFAGAGTGIVSSTVSTAVVSGATTIYLASTKGFANGMYVYGGMIPAGATISAVTSSKITLSGSFTTSSAAPIGATVVASPTPSAGDNIKFGGKEIVLAGNIIQQGGGWGADLTSARSGRVEDNFLDGNGRNLPGTGAIRINNSGHITVCSNTISQSGLASIVSQIPTVAPLYNAAHILFSGVDDSISLCGNVYLPIVSSGSNSSYAGNPSTVLNPDYTYDADPSSVLTNISITDNLAPQLVDIFTPNASMLLKGSVRTSPTPGVMTGLTLSNDAANSPIVDIAPGSATDSTGTTQINLATKCQVNLTGAGGMAGVNGPGGLDYGSAATQTTYYFFVISGPGGTNPSCMASTKLTPSFAALPAAQTIPLAGQSTTGSGVIFNVSPGTTIQAPNSLNANPLGGIMAGDQIASSAFSATPTTIQSLAPFRLIGVPATITTSPMPQNEATTTSGFAGVLPGMAVAGVTVPSGSAGIPPNTVVGTSCGTNCLNLVTSPAATISPGPIVLTFGSNFTLTLPSGVTANSPGGPITATVYPGRYRLVGALYTTSPAGTLVSFKQDGNTFYLTQPAVDLTAANCGITTTAGVKCALSVPCGRSANTCGYGLSCASAPVNALIVQAFGRIAGGTTSGTANASIMLSSPDQSLTAPTADLTTSPGYATTKTTTPPVTYPFLSYTDACGDVMVQASVSGNNAINGITDGWVLPR